MQAYPPIKHQSESYNNITKSTLYHNPQTNLNRSYKNSTKFNFAPLHWLEFPSPSSCTSAKNKTVYKSEINSTVFTPNSKGVHTKSFKKIPGRGHKYSTHIHFQLKHPTTHFLLFIFVATRVSCLTASHGLRLGLT